MKHLNPLPVLELLQRNLSYNPNTGTLTDIKTGAPTSTRLDSTGYARVTKGPCTGIAVHRLAWALYYKTDPYPHILDHIDQDKSNNRIDNLRLSTVSLNLANRGKQRNNTSGYKGVHLHKPNGRWRAQIKVNGKVIKLGYFVDIQDAAMAYRAAAIFYFGEHANW
jgi:V8-like Glu-specific endopeptidase